MGLQDGSGVVEEVGFIALFGVFRIACRLKDLGRHGSDVQWPEIMKEALAENPGQGLTRHWRIGSQDIPWPVASQQSLPPLLLTAPFQQNAESSCNCWTSESCLGKSTR